MQGFDQAETLYEPVLALPAKELTLSKISNQPILHHMLQ